MPFNRPTLKELISRAADDVVTTTGKARARFRWYTEGAIAYAIAGLAHGLHGHLQWLSRQIIFDTADEEYLRRWANLLAGLDILEAQQSAGDIIVTGVETTALPINTVFVRSDGVEFQTLTAEVVLNGQITVEAQSLDPGADKNMEPGEIMEISNTIVGIDPVATVDVDGINGGRDRETTEELLERLLDTLDNFGAGGTEGEYKQWAIEGGADEAFVFPKFYGPGSVLVVIDTDTGAPPDSLVVQVFDYIDFRNPATDELTVFGAVHTDLAFEIQDLEIDPGFDLATVKANIATQLEEMLARDGGTLDSEGVGVTIKLSRISEAISLAPGEHSHVLVSPSQDPIFQLAEVPDLGVVTYTFSP